MPFIRSTQPGRLLAVTFVVTYLSACATVAKTDRAVVDPSPVDEIAAETVEAVHAFPAPPPDLTARTSAWWRAVLVRGWWGVVASRLAEARARASSPPAARRLVFSHPMPAPSAPSSAGYSAVMQCIKDHESGDYGNHSNGPDGASGAFQVIGSTWRAWSARAGHGGYYAAWEAPGWVQDAVVVFMLANGGAHNWDPRYGNDPCTVGLP